MAGTNTQIAVIYPSGPMKCESTKLEQRIQIIEAAGYKVHNLSLFHPGTEGVTAGTAIERAAMVSHALTRRMYDVVWAARGGYGTTAIVPFLRNMLPPILPKQRLIGFSDVSFLGVSVALPIPRSPTFMAGISSRTIFLSATLSKIAFFQVSLTAQAAPRLTFPSSPSRIANHKPR